MFIDKFSKVIEYGLYLFVFLLPWQTRLILRPGEINGGYSEYLSISLYFSDIVLFILLALFSVYWYKFQIFKNKFFILAGLELFIFISIFFASDKLLAFYRYGLFLLGVGLFFLILKVNYNYSKLVWAFLVGVFLQASLGIYQFLNQSSFACKWLGLAKHNPIELGVSVIETMGSDGIGERWLRAYGGLDHPNIFGGLLSVGIVLLIANGLPILKTKNFQFSIFNSLIFKFITYYLFLITFISALFFTFSRAAWLATGVGIACLFIISIIKKNLLAQREILKTILAGSILVFVLFSQYGNLVKTRVGGDTRLENKSNSERLVYIQEAKEIIKNNLFFGVGIGNYVLAVKDFHPNKKSWDYQGVHNVFLLVLAEIGILGFIFLLWFIVYELREIWHLNDQKIGIKLSLLASIFIVCLFDHWLWSLHFGVLFFWFLFGLILKKEKMKGGENE